MAQPEETYSTQENPIYNIPACHTTPNCSCFTDLTARKPSLFHTQYITATELWLNEVLKVFGEHAQLDTIQKVNRYNVVSRHTILESLKHFIETLKFILGMVLTSKKIKHEMLHVTFHSGIEVLVTKFIQVWIVVLSSSYELTMISKNDTSTFDSALSMFICKLHIQTINHLKYVIDVL